LRKNAKSYKIRVEYSIKNMKELLEEIKQIPEAATECLKQNKDLKLPTHVPYLGMGASYYAALTAAGAGAPVWPHLASEYYAYLGKGKLPQGVLISQSGETSEVLWNLERFKQAVAITNNPKGALAKAAAVKKTVLLHAGLEKSSATKTFINTLVVLYAGLGLKVLPAVTRLSKHFSELRAAGERQAELIFQYYKSHRVQGLFVLGSGPNFGSAGEAALALAEVTKLPWQGLELAQFDHGPKEAAENSVVVFLDGAGRDKKRRELMVKILKSKSNALIATLAEHALPEALTPFSLVAQAYFMAHHLADLLQVKRTYRLGGKITAAPKAVKGS
jgi:glucosamine--fructose-6-phosphate aminotransferase (isomerizing)